MDTLAKILKARVDSFRKLENDKEIQCQVSDMIQHQTGDGGSAGRAGQAGGGPQARLPPG